MHMGIGSQALGDWDDVRIFLAVVRAGSYSRAAQRLGTRQSTVSRRIQALEHRLGTKLFDHRGHGMRPTPAADVMVPHVERMESEALALERELVDVDAEPRGVVRVTGSEGLISCWVLPNLPAFNAAHPAIMLDTLATSRYMDLGAREADIALRFGEPRDPRLISRSLGTVRYRFYASTTYLDANGTPASLDQLYDHAVVDLHHFHWADELGIWRSFIESHPRVRVRVTALSSYLEALESGLGIGLLPPYIAQSRPDMIDVALDFGYRLNLKLLTHEETRHSARIRAVSDFLRERAHTDRAFLFES
ncbi:transcriptional regulator, LysR family [Limimonas halophila]|uniref:Transcriptional regulator, LysR family n=1 Tax=Limimonas halophila TaxID=1082479 RepID=A0A1G7RWK2_9PROT|nr:LysR family transcriptional regulator [Limimonas halophila]SDG15197.1 transcriptional regulator, LysR family [Limimonas halophila]